MTESDAVKYLELSMPDLVAAARYRKQGFQREVAEREAWSKEYAALPFWRKPFFPSCNARSHPNIALQADNSVEWHIDWLQRHPDELARVRLSMVLSRMADKQGRESV